MRHRVESAATGIVRGATDERGRAGTTTGGSNSDRRDLGPNQPVRRAGRGDAAGATWIVCRETYPAQRRHHIKAQNAALQHKLMHLEAKVTKLEGALDTACIRTRTQDSVREHKRRSTMPARWKGG